MSEPHESLLAQFEARRGQPKLFHGPTDGALLDKFVSEHMRLMGGHVNLIPHSTERNPQGELQTPGVDELDGDIPNPEFLDFDRLNTLKLDMPCLIEHEPSKQLHTRFGVDEQRQILFYFSFADLKAKGLVTPVRFRGIALYDLIEYDGTFYVVWSVHRSSYFGQSDKFLHTAAFCDRYRLDAIGKEA
jgi:hypothetical protein